MFSAALCGLAGAAALALVGLHAWPDAPLTIWMLAMVGGVILGAADFRIAGVVPSLQWDGHAWSAVGRSGVERPLLAAPDVVVDWDSWVLLRVTCDGSRWWMLANAGPDRGAWHRVRAALHGGRTDREPSAALPG